MKINTVLLVLFPITALTAFGSAMDVSLGTADPFAVLAGSTITSTGLSVVNGDVGLSPGTAVTGFPPGVVTPPSTIHAADAVALQAQKDLTTAYGFAAGQPCGTSLTGQDLGGLTLGPGVYCFSSSAQLTGTLTLNAMGNPNSVFIFQIGSSLTTANGSKVAFTNGGQGDSLFWQVGSSATLGTTTDFAGNILALTSITLDTGANIGCGRALARNGAVTMDSNGVSIDTEGCETSTTGTAPEPATLSLLGLGLLAGAAIMRSRKYLARSATTPVL